MNHDERNFVEILKRLNDVEKKLRNVGNNKTTISYGSDSHSTDNKDHRLLSNLNSEDFMHLTGEEYRSVILGAGDHGSLTGLLDNDHPQYVRHSIAGYEWDMLAAERNAITGQLVFVRKGIDDVRSEIAEKLFPQVDSTTAMGFYKSDETTPVLAVDTLNSRIGIGIQPSTALHVNGTTTIADGNIVFDNNITPSISSDIDLLISANDGVFINSTAVGVILSNNTNMRSETFAEDVYGWNIKNSGDAYFRNVKVNKINARIVSTGVEQYVGGRQTMCKSASPLTDNFTVPAPSGNCMLHVEPFSDYPLISVFANGDIVRLVHISLYDGKYNTADCWGTVTFSAFSVPGKQSYIFTRSSGANSGSAIAGSIIPAGELVLNFGVSGDGYIVSTVV